MSDVNKMIGTTLKKMRQYRKLSQGDVAKKINCGNNYIANIEAGRTAVSIKKLAEFSHLYNCYLDIKLTPIESE